MKNIDADIKANSFKRAYLIFGDEKYLTSEYENRLKHAVVPKEAELMNTVVFDGAVNIDDISSAMETLPFFSNYRLIIIKDSGIFKSGKKDLSSQMAALVKTIPETAVLLFANEDVDKRNSLYKAVKKYGYVCEINTLKDSELIKWVEKASKGRVKGNTAAYFVHNIGKQLEAINTELDKLLSYSKDNTITAATIDAVCAKSLEANMFDMLEAMGNKQADKALDIYGNMLLMKQSPVAVLTMTARQFKMLLQCKYLLKKNYTKSQIAYELSLREFMVEKYISQCKHFSLSKLMEACRDCADLDVRFKQGLISDILGVEMLILKYSK